MLKIILITFLSISLPLWALAQESENAPKVKHADPVFEDLTTELGVYKGFYELNTNFGYRKLEDLHHTLLSQLEFEFAPVNNLGFELLIPYTAYFTNPVLQDPRPGNSLEFLQWTVQYTFYQSPQRGISMAVGFENAFERQDPYISPQERQEGFSIANIIYQPFLIVAKNWKDRYFILFNGGPGIDQDLEENTIDLVPQLTTAFHYRLSNENDHFLGVELNKSIEEGDFEMFVRPQIKIEITDNFNIGTALGIPVAKPETKWSAFMRVAYEL